MSENQFLDPWSSEATMILQCPYCGAPGCAIQRRESVSLKKGSKVDDSTWNIEGKVKLVYCIHGLCENCGNMYEIVNREIPILYPSLKCRICKSSDHMECEVESWHIDPWAFNFAAVVTCKKCGKKVGRKFAKAIKEFWKVTKIKLSLRGVEIEKGA